MSARSRRRKPDQAPSRWLTSTTTGCRSRRGVMRAASIDRRDDGARRWPRHLPRGRGEAPRALVATPLAMGFGSFQTGRRALVAPAELDTVEPVAEVVSSLVAIGLPATLDQRWFQAASATKTVPRRTVTRLGSCPSTNHRNGTLRSKSTARRSTNSAKTISTSSRPESQNEWRCRARP